MSEHNHAATTVGGLFSCADVVDIQAHVHVQLLLLRV